VRRIGAHGQRVAIGRGTRRSLGADVAAGAGLVVDIETLSERLGEPFGDVTRGDVGPLSGLIRDDDPDRLLRISLRDGERGEGEAGGDGGDLPYQFQWVSSLS
jgi:hypothetical protein